LDVRMVGWMERCTDGSDNGRAYIRMEGCSAGSPGVRSDGRMCVWNAGRSCGWSDVSMDGSVFGRIDQWAGGCSDG